MSEEYKYIITKGISIFISGLRYNLASIVTMATLVFMYLAVFTVNHSVENAIGTVSDAKTIRVFLEDNAEKEKIEEALSVLSIKGDISFFDREDSKKRVMEMTPDNEDLADLSEELFPRFFEIHTEGPDEKYLDIISKNLDETEGVKSVESGKKQNEKLERIKNVSSFFVFMLTLLTGVSCAFIIFNTIRLSLYKHHRAIMLYTLVGATRSFITFPYAAASKIETTVAFLAAVFMNRIFIAFMSKSLLAESVFTIASPGFLSLLWLYLLLMVITSLAAIFSVVTFLMRQKSINEV